MVSLYNDIWFISINQQICRIGVTRTCVRGYRQFFTPGPRGWGPDIGYMESRAIPLPRVLGRRPLCRAVPLAVCRT